MWEKARNKRLSTSYRIKALLSGFIIQHPVPSQFDICFLLHPHLPPTSENFPSRNSEFWEFPCLCAHVVSHLCDVFQGVLFVWIFLPTYTILFNLQDSAQALFPQETFPGLTFQVKLSTPSYMQHSAVLALIILHWNSGFCLPTVTSTKGASCIICLGIPNASLRACTQQRLNKCFLIWTETPKSSSCHQVSLVRDKSGSYRQRGMESEAFLDKSHYADRHVDHMDHSLFIWSAHGLCST